MEVANVVRKVSTKSQLLNVIIWVFQVTLQGDVPYLMSHSHDPLRGVCVPEKAGGCPLVLATWTMTITTSTSIAMSLCNSSIWCSAQHNNKIKPN